MSMTGSLPVNADNINAVSVHMMASHGELAAHGHSLCIMNHPEVPPGGHHVNADSATIVGVDGRDTAVVDILVRGQAW